MLGNPRMVNILEENELEELITRVIEEPTSNTTRATYRKKQAKAKRIIFDSVKDIMMPIIGYLRTAKECFDALANLYVKKAPTQKRILKKQLRTLRMGKDNSFATFFSKIAQTKDQLIAIGVPVDDDDLVQIAFDGLTESWGVFLASVNGREVQRNFDRLWHDCLEKEGRLESRNESSLLSDHGLSPKTKKWKKFPQAKGKGKKPQGKLSHLNPHLFKVKCFNCNKLGHYARDCRNPPSQQKRRGRFQASVATEEAKPRRRQTMTATKEQEQQKECYLISALSGTITKSEEIWLIDSGASRHMTGFKQNLANYQDTKFKAKVEMGDDDTYDIKGFGSTSFRFQSGNIFYIDEILYVPSLKKNLISVPVLESKGYSVAFSKGKALMWSSNEDINSAITIGTRESGLYKNFKSGCSSSSSRDGKSLRALAQKIWTSQLQRTSRFAKDGDRYANILCC
jgi:hypothetical protein